MHRSSNASREYLVSGWLRVTEAQVSDGAALLRPLAGLDVRCMVFLEHLMFQMRRYASMSFSRAELLL